MTHSTSTTYTLKRDILSFSNIISKQLSKPKRKFATDMTYGMFASKNCLLTDISNQLHETSKKINVVYRLSTHLSHGNPKQALRIFPSFVYGFPMNLLYILMTLILSNLMVTILKHWVLFEMALKTHKQKCLSKGESYY